MDWLTGTQPADDISEFNPLLPDGFEQVEKLRPTTLYYHRWKLKPAGTLSMNSEGNISQMIEFTGSDLATLRENGVTDIAILKHVKTECSHLTRVDYAVDIKDTTVTALDFLTLWRYGHFTTRMRKCRHFTEEKEQDATTVYWGSPSSNRMLRIYDKAGQLDLLNEAWLRVEMQSRKVKADTLGADMITHGLTAAGDQCIKDTVKVDSCPVLRDAMDDWEVTLKEVPRKDTSWRDWMNGQVYKSCLTHAQNEQDATFLLDWMKRLTSAINQA